MTKYIGLGWIWPMRRSLSLLLFSWFLFQARAADLQVFAAASLTDALQEISRAYPRSSSEKVFFNFAASSILARQIQEGAPADIFFSADEEKMDQLSRRGLIVTSSRRKLLGNSLVIMVAPHLVAGFTNANQLIGLRRIAIAEPSTVPAGIYARTYLERVKIWNRVTNSVIPVENVRAALAAVEAGNADAAIVYKTDAAIAKKAQVALEVPAAETPGISYSIAILKRSRQAESAAAFVAYLESPPARAVFQKAGFITDFPR